VRRTVLGYWGQVCDDGFGMINADVICKELGFIHGALEIRPGGFYGNLDPPTRFMVDQLKCRGNETTLRECDFNGWEGLILGPKTRIARISASFDGD